MPPAPGNPAVIIDPNTGGGNNTRDFNRDGTARMPYHPKRDFGDHQSSPSDPRMVTDAKDLPIYGFLYFDSARRGVEARRNGLLSALNGGNGSGSARSNNRNGSRSASNSDNNRNGNDANTERFAAATVPIQTTVTARTDATTGTTAAVRRRITAPPTPSDAATPTVRMRTPMTPLWKRTPSYRDGCRGAMGIPARRDAIPTTTGTPNDPNNNRPLDPITGYPNNPNGQYNPNNRNNPNFPNNPGNPNFPNNGQNGYPYGPNNGYYNNGYNNGYNGYNNGYNPFPQRSTVSGYEGIIDPLTQLTNNIIASPPSTYQLSGGDEVVIHITTPKLPAMDIDRMIDNLGNLDLGEMGRIVVRGKTLDQLERDLQTRALRYYKGAQVSLSLKQLRSISVTVQGEAVQPGTYVVPGVISAFNMLYGAGGPTIDGSLREIKVMREGKEFKTLDFYKFMKGDGQEDVIMRAGDMLVIPPSGARVALIGEVRHPALYEMKDDESLKDALKFAGGVKASGVDQIVQLNTLEPGQNRVLKNINLRDKTQVEAVRLYDGDSVEIHSVRQIVDNKVHVSGAISQPGDYALTPGMRVADLLRIARNPISEAYLGRAALKRWNGDNTTTLIPIDLAKAIENDPQSNIPLMKWDSLEIYSRTEAAFVGTRKIEVRGAVQREGVYEYSQNMRVLDILLRAGGALPNAERIEIIHQHGDGTYKYGTRSRGRCGAWRPGEKHCPRRQRHRGRVQKHGSAVYRRASGARGRRSGHAGLLSARRRHAPDGRPAACRLVPARRASERENRPCPPFRGCPKTLTTALCPCSSIRSCSARRRTICGWKTAT